MRKKVFFLFLSIIFFSIFLLFSYLVQKDLLLKWDFDTTVYLQKKIPKKFDPYLSTFSLIGSFEIYSLIIFITALLRKKITAFLVFIPYAFAHIVEILGKFFLHQPPPPSLLHRYALDFHFLSSYFKPGYAYPSGHSMRTVFVSFLISYLILKSKVKKSTKVFLLTVILIFNMIMLLSRVTLGEHWPTDVVGGVFLGVSSAFFAFLFL